MKFNAGDLVWFEQPTVSLNTGSWDHHRVPETIYQVLPRIGYTLSPTSLVFPEEMFAPRDASEPTPCWSCGVTKFGKPRNHILVCPHCEQDIPAQPLIPGKGDAQSQQLDANCWECMGEIHCQICGADSIEN